MGECVKLLIIYNCITQQLKDRYII